MRPTPNDEYAVRLQKLERLRELGIQPYPDSFKKTHTGADVKTVAEGTAVTVAGRILTVRAMGKIAFAHVLDASGRFQIVLKQEDLGERFDQFVELFDAGDFIGARGETFVTKAGEPSVGVKEFVLLGKALRPLPEKWHGLKDQEVQYRQRYLDLIANPETYQRFLLRSSCIRLLREFYWSHGFIEVETPILTNTPSGALAKPFQTHHNALGTDVFLRIAPETYLKECVVGGFERVFEIGRVFRNEGIDPSHLQDYTSAEHYAAYWNYEDNMRFTEEMFTFLLQKLFGTDEVQVKGRDGNVATIRFHAPWTRVTFSELIRQDAGIELADHPTAPSLLKAIQAKKIQIDDAKQLGRGNLIDALYKTVSRHKLIQPTFVTHHPTDVSPLARRNDADPSTVDQFQLIVNGWEIIKAYSELVDPLDQAQRFDVQVQAREGGDVEAHVKDTEFVRALEHGAPPISGWGMGIDRLVTLLTQQDNLRDVVLFPLMRPADSYDE